MKRVILIGIDSISWGLIDQFIDKLPNFAKLKREGKISILESTYPPISPPGWVSLFTGFEPIHHHIFDFIKRRKDSYFVEPIFSDDRKKPFIWEYLNKKNKRTIAIGIPFSYPPESLNGILVSGLGTPSKDSEYSYPKELKDYIEKKYPDFDVDFEENNLGDLKVDEKYILRKIKKVTDSQFLVGKELFQKEKWDLFSLVFRSTDIVQHYFINKKKILFEYYQQVDSYLGWFVKNMQKDDILLVCSDHGGSQVHTRFNINTWLFKNNYLNIGKKPLININLLNIDAIETRLLKSPFKNSVWKLKRSRLIEYFLFFAQFFSKSKLLGDLKNVDWNKTRLYSLPTSTGLLFLNQIGREPSGIVDYRERASILSDFKEKMLKLGFEGKRVIREVVVLDDKYPNRSNSDTHIPDCIIIPNEGFTLHPTFSTTTDIFVPEKIRVGDHTPDGIFIAYKKDIRISKTRKMGRNHIYDIVPTILDFFSIDTGLKFDGKSILKSDWV